MIQIEANLLAIYNLVLQKQGIPENEQGYYIKWLRYYLDFYNKYGFNKSDSASIPKFIDKLQSKKQNKKQ